MWRENARVIRRAVLLVAIVLCAFPLSGATSRRHGVRLRRLWRPAVDTSWQIQFQGTIDTSLPVAMYDIDLFDSPVSTIATLHSAGIGVACYVNAGAWEDWRSDAAEFPASVIGNDYAGWPGEKWLDVRRIDLLAPILRARFDQCAAKGFDAIDPDNVDVYQQNSGFAITYADQLAFNRFLATEAHARSLSIGLKNDYDQAADLAADFDWAIDESCFKNGECMRLTPFLDSGKAVLDIEYTDEGSTLDSFCSQAASIRISAILKNRSLDAWIARCP
jgi:hypothetical protein